MKLNPDELTVASFDTTAAAIEPTRPIVARPTTTLTGDPTAATWCYVCPVYTETFY